MKSLIFNQFSFNLKNINISILPIFFLPISFILGNAAVNFNLIFIVLIFFCRLVLEKGRRVTGINRQLSEIAYKFQKEAEMYQE